MRNAEQRGYQVGMAYKGSTTSPEDAGRQEIKRLLQSGYAHLEPAEEALRGFLAALKIKGLLRQTGENSDASR